MLAMLTRTSMVSSRYSIKSGHHGGASPLERGESREDCTLWALLRPVMGCESSRPESDALGSTLW